MCDAGRRRAGREINSTLVSEGAPYHTATRTNPPTCLNRSPNSYQRSLPVTVCTTYLRSRLLLPRSLSRLCPLDMPVCVECSSPVPHLWREVIPGTIRLTRCSHCGCVADPYIEYETVLVLLDLVGQKKEAYRHLLYNTHHSIARRIPPALLWAALIAAQTIALAAIALLAADSFTALSHI